MGAVDVPADAFEFDDGRCGSVSSKRVGVVGKPTDHLDPETDNRLSRKVSGGEHP